MDNVEVRVSNLSAEASAVNTLVRVHWAVFGIGTPFTPLGDRMISLGFEPDFKLLYFPINQAIRNLGNDVSLRVTISHPHDKATDNNVGYQAIHGVRTSQASRTPSMNFTVVNPSAAAQTIKLVVLSNEIGGVVTPALRAFAPNEQITATLTAHVPAAIVPPAGGDVLKDVTVVGYDGDGTVIGGVTLLVRVDS